MNGRVYRLVDSGMLRRPAGVAISLLLAGSIVAGVPGPANTLAPGKQAKQPRMLEKKAVTRVYFYAPSTLAITSVTSHFFRDVDACESAVGGHGALKVAGSVGDRPTWSSRMGRLFSCSRC
jgi:hypothetical protein